MYTAQLPVMHGAMVGKLWLLFVWLKMNDNKLHYGFPLPLHWLCVCVCSGFVLAGYEMDLVAVVCCL